MSKREVNINTFHTGLGCVVVHATGCVYHEKTKPRSSAWYTETVTVPDGHITEQRLSIQRQIVEKWNNEGFTIISQGHVQVCASCIKEG